MSGATCKSELPNPQKALTKLTKGVVRGAFVSFVSAFLCPQISKTDLAAAEASGPSAYNHACISHRADQPRSGRDRHIILGDSLAPDA